MRSTARTQPALPIRFPVNLEGRLLPGLWREFKSELQRLQYPAQEAVCQIVCAYRQGYSPKVQDSVNIERKKLRTIGRRLASFIHTLPLENDILAVGEEIRSLHRPPGVPGSVREFFRVHELGDYVDSHKEYFTQANLPDPAKPLDDLIEDLRNAKEFLDKQIEIIKSKVQTEKSLPKSSPHLWWRSGGIYYLLERIYREGSIKYVTQAEAHKQIRAVMIKIRRGRLRFDIGKGYCPAIRSAVERMPAAYKRRCDEYLHDWIGLLPKAPLPTAKI